MAMYCKAKNRMCEGCCKCIDLKDMICPVCGSEPTKFYVGGYDNIKADEIVGCDECIHEEDAA